MTDYTANDYARLAHWQTQKPRAQQNPELIDALLYAKELASARGTTEACEARRQAARGGGTVVEKTRETSPIDYTEREVRDKADLYDHMAILCTAADEPEEAQAHRETKEMLTQLADMLVEREKASNEFPKRIANVPYPNGANGAEDRLVGFVISPDHPWYGTGLSDPLFAMERALQERCPQPAPDGQNAKDAARYRWLRNADISDPLIPYDEILRYAGSSLDAAIDSAMKDSDHD